MTNLTALLETNIDILCIVETKLDASYPKSQFYLQWYKSIAIWRQLK